MNSTKWQNNLTVNAWFQVLVNHNITQFPFWFCCNHLFGYETVFRTRLLGFWGTLTNHPWMVMKVLKISLFKNSETLSQRVYKTEKKTETCFMVFLEQNTSDKICTVSVLEGKAPWNVICSKGIIVGYWWYFMRIFRVVLSNFVGVYWTSIFFSDDLHWKVMCETQVA